MRHPFRTLRGKAVISVASLALLAVVAGAAVYSAFSSTVSSGSNSFSSGSIDLATSGTGIALFNLPSMKPADTSSSCVEVTYSGTIAADVVFYGTQSGLLAPYLTTTVTRGSFPGTAPASNGCTGFVPDGGADLFAGTLATLPVVGAPVTDPATSWVAEMFTSTSSPSRFRSQLPMRRRARRPTPR